MFVQVEVPEWYVPGAVRAASPETPRATNAVRASHAATEEVVAAFDITHGEQSSVLVSSLHALYAEGNIYLASTLHAAYAAYAMCAVYTACPFKAMCAAYAVHAIRQSHFEHHG